MTGSATRDEREPHLEAGEVARHVTGASPPAERTRIEAHLAVCDSCTEDVMAAWRFARRRRMRPALLGVGIAAAAAIAGLLLLPSSRAPSRAGPVVRGSTAGSARALVIVAPREGQTASRPLVLTWRAHPDMATYKISLAQADGDSVWSAITEDTTVSLPDSVRLVPGHDYLWYVDGLEVDGRALTSGIHRFRLRP
jgi:hypothetical protein